MLDDGIITYHLDGNHGSDYPRNEEFVESGVSYISANCIIDDTVNLNLAKHLTEERAAKLRKALHSMKMCYLHTTQLWGQ